MNWSDVNNRYNDDKIIEGCSLFGMMNLKGERFSSRDPVRAIANMHERGNGLGGGFAIYGLYPEHRQDYALHIMYLDKDAKKRTERFLKEEFHVNIDEEIPTREAKVVDPPILWRYFVQPRRRSLSQSDDDYVMEKVMKINTQTGKTFVFSSGKDMGVFKGVGFPEDIAEYFCLEEYRGYMWTCHGRFPTNTPGWWGGAHPFSILDWTVVHNGEISSYGINRRHLEMYGYKCTMQTDTEVLAYTFDLLIRRHHLPIEVAAQVIAPPFWDEIDRQPPQRRQLLTALRQTYGSLLMNGPFSIIVAHQGEMIGLTDRIKLRPLSAGLKGDFLYLSSEESAINLVATNPDRIWRPKGGEPVVGRLIQGVKELLVRSEKQ
ncbi:MAG: class II glutamine amidotransferase [Nitrososphaeria archaeon]